MDEPVDWLRVTRRFLTGKRWYGASGVKNRVAFVDGNVAVCIKRGRGMCSGGVGGEMGRGERGGTRKVAEAPHAEVAVVVGEREVMRRVFIC